MTRWTELNEFDRWACVRRLPQHLRTLMEKRGRTVFVAGGYVRSCVSGEPVNDIDIFVSDAEQAQNLACALYTGDNTSCAHYLYEDKNKGAGPRQTPNSWVLTNGGHNIQVIHRWSFLTPQECAESFDFTIAKSAIWWDGSWKTICHPQFYADLAAKRLVYTSPQRNEDAGGSMLRVLKFYQRGFRIPLDSLGAVISRLISGMTPEQLSSGEWMCAQTITGLLREVDPLVDPFAAAHIDTPGEL